jgi:hypothetical protein
MHGNTKSLSKKSPQQPGGNRETDLGQQGASPEVGEKQPKMGSDI